MDIDSQKITIRELFSTISTKYQEKIAFQIREERDFKRITYGELHNRTIDVASSLIRMGIRKNDKVAILSENRPEWGIAFFGIISSGAIVVPLDISLKENDIQYILTDSEARCIFVSKRFLGLLDKIRLNCPNLEIVISLEEEVSEVINLSKLKYNEGEEYYREITEEDTALIVYTSGTMGFAKGVEITFGNLLFQVMSLEKVIAYDSEDRFLSVLPLNHMLEMIGGFLGPLYKGGCITYCRTLNSEEIISTMRQTRPTLVVCVPLILKTLHRRIFKSIESTSWHKKLFFYLGFSICRIFRKINLDLSKIFFREVHLLLGGNLRCFISGGAPLDPKIMYDFELLGIPILQGYGLTETSPVISVNTFEEKKIGSVGKPLPGVQIQIIKSSESDSEGEIITKGPHVMKGYYRNPQMTEEVLKDGWLHTGDIGYLDRDGFLYITGRLKNLIVTQGGKKVHPEEVEEALLKSPYIKECCVVGRIVSEREKIGSEQVYAIIFPDFEYFKERKVDISSEEVESIIKQEIENCTSSLADFKRPSGFEIWERELPKTSSRKIKRKDVLESIKERRRLLKKETVEFTELFKVEEDEFIQKIKRSISKVIGISEDQIKPSSNLYIDLGVDSLMKIEIICTIEKDFGIKIPDELGYSINTFSDLIRLIKEYEKGRRDLIEIKDEDIQCFLKENMILKLTRFFAYTFFKILYKYYFRTEACGVENLPQENSFIIASNHTSLLDFPLIFCAIPYKKAMNVIAPAAKDYFYTRPLRRRLVELAFNAFPFERTGNFVRGLKICAKLLEKKKSIILFPEGTRSVKGTLQEFKPGLGSLAFNLDIPIIPCYIKGTYEAMPKGSSFPKPYKVKICFAPCITMERYRPLKGKISNYHIYEKIAEDVRNEVIRLKDGGFKDE